MPDDCGCLTEEEGHSELQFCCLNFVLKHSCISLHVLILWSYNPAVRIWTTKVAYRTNKGCAVQALGYAAVSFNMSCFYVVNVLRIH